MYFSILEFFFTVVSICDFRSIVTSSTAPAEGICPVVAPNTILIIACEGEAVLMREAEADVLLTLNWIVVVVVVAVFSRPTVTSGELLMTLMSCLVVEAVLITTFEAVVVLTMIEIIAFVVWAVLILTALAVKELIKTVMFCFVLEAVFVSMTVPTSPVVCPVKIDICAVVSCAVLVETLLAVVVFVMIETKDCANCEVLIDTLLAVVVLTKNLIKDWAKDDVLVETFVAVVVLVVILTIDCAKEMIALLAFETVVKPGIIDSKSFVVEAVKDVCGGAVPPPDAEADNAPVKVFMNASVAVADFISIVAGLNTNTPDWLS